jgi:class 3 adenylate cyclase
MTADNSVRLAHAVCRRRTAIGTVTNLAARLCGEAKDGQILISRSVAIAVEDTTTLDEIGDLSLKGLSQAVAVYNVVQ